MSLSAKTRVFLLLICFIALVFSLPTFTTVSFFQLIDLLRGKFSISSAKFKWLTSLILIVPLLYVFQSQLNIPQLLHKMNNSYKFLGNNRSRMSGHKSRETRFAAKNGGEIGGISNDGNTCFMNSVIQSLASSRQLLKFIDSYFYNEIEVDGAKVKTNLANPDLVFTSALKKLFDSVNGSYGTRRTEFSTKPLLNRMPNGPKQNFFTGYNQEDAQEFYHLVMTLIEKEYLKVVGAKKEKPDFVDASSISDLTIGCENLGKLGKVYVPAYQIDPNLVDSDKVYPLDLVTPVDGVSVERIGCMTCGEVGGIRYSVLSGLSLNLPSTQSYYSSCTIKSLLQNWIEPEIIDEVNCNRCGLNQTREFLTKKISESNNEKLSEIFNKRIAEIDIELAKNHITDEVFERLTTNLMITKSRKLKQILLGRPAPLLSIHINRSVFDPRTYLIVKNPSNVLFPAQLDLSPYVAEPDDINMDARLAFRKQDEKKESEETPSDSESSNETPEDADMSDSSDVPPANPKLLYQLKAVISHYGTHNYGHYICYRKLRGTWWRISDESVYVTTEDEVLNSQGTFMLFYEVDDGYREVLQQLDSEDEKSSEESEKSADESESESEKEKSEDDKLDSDYESSGLSDDHNSNEFDAGEERAFHI